jgi:glutathionylspermidine synthase
VSDIGEELLTTHYISTTAALAGLETVGIDLSEVGHDENTNEFVDLEDNTISNLFKLYPWEDLTNNDYADKLLLTDSIRFIEPSWKMLLSNKALLPKLYERFPDCPYLLRAYFTKEKFTRNEQYVEKALFGREGEGITLFLNDTQETCPSLEKGYGEEGYVYQEYTPLYEADGNVAVLGVWMIGDQASGLGVREDTSKITKNTSMFVPHCFI